jgi:uncharacterized membrane protein
MAKYCTQCGVGVNEHARFCNKCGARLAPTQTAPQQQPAANPTINYQTPPGDSNYRDPDQQPPYQAPYPQPEAPRVPAAGMDLKPNVAALLCYPLFFITGILFLVLTPYNKDPEVRFHAYQSIFFSVLIVAFNVIVNIFTAMNPFDAIDDLMRAGLTLVIFGGMAWLMYQAYLGNRFKLPVIGELAETQAMKQ